LLQLLEYGTGLKTTGPKDQMDSAATPNKVQVFEALDALHRRRGEPLRRVVWTNDGFVTWAAQGVFEIKEQEGGGFLVLDRLRGTSAKMP
jgi:hypothetical protein